MEIFDDKKVLITGGTGTFGQALTNFLLKETKVSKLVILSRDEMKQWDMSQKYGSDERLRFFIGDVRDAGRLRRAFSGMDFVVHAAAMKIVPTAEYNPIECIKTNVNGAINVIDAAIDMNVERVVALSTDKAVAPVNLYGATKLTSDKLFVAANSYSGSGRTKFSVVRYGNVMGSRGSVIPYFQSIKSDGALPVTDSKMTRFMITLEQGIDLVAFAFQDMHGGEIYVKKIPSMNILDIVKAIKKDAQVKLVGIRPGEKIHEQMITLEDAYNTIEFAEYFIIKAAENDFRMSNCFGEAGTLVGPDFLYSSDQNTDWMSVETLRDWIKTQYIPSS